MSTPAVEYVLQEVAAHTDIVISKYTGFLSYLLSSPAAVQELQRVITSVINLLIAYLYSSAVD